MSAGPDDFSALQRLVADSRLRQLWLTAGAWSAAAWKHSRSRRLCADLAAAGEARTTEARLRTVATLVASASLWSLVLRAFTPEYVAAGIPLALIAEVSVLALAVAAQPGAFIRAWDGSRVALAVRGRRSAWRSESTPANGRPTS